MALSGDPVVLINRTSKPLSFKADGRDYVLKPGKNYGLTTAHVKFAKGQNPLPGTEDYYSLAFESLVGVEGGKNPTDEISDETLDALKGVERFDVSTMDPEAQKGRSRQKGRYLHGRGSVSMATANSMAVGG